MLGRTLAGLRQRGQSSSGAVVPRRRRRRPRRPEEGVARLPRRVLVAGLVGLGRGQPSGHPRPLTREARRRSTAKAGSGLLSEDRGGEGLMLHSNDRRQRDALARCSALWAWPSQVLAGAGKKWIVYARHLASGGPAAQTAISGEVSKGADAQAARAKTTTCSSSSERGAASAVRPKAQVLELVRDLTRREGAGAIVPVPRPKLDEAAHDPRSGSRSLRRGELRCGCQSRPPTTRNGGSRLEASTRRAISVKRPLRGFGPLIAVVITFAIFGALTPDIHPARPGAADDGASDRHRRDLHPPA